MTLTAWLRRRWGRRSVDVVRAYRRALDPDTEAGRLVLADLAQECHVGRSTFRPGDPTASAFEEGKRAVWLHLAAMLDLPIDRLSDLVKEVRE